MSGLVEMGKRSKVAALALSQAKTKQKNEALLALAERLVANTAIILAANKNDLAAAADNGVKDAMLDRLRLTAERVVDMAEGVKQVAALADPIGEVTHMWKNEADLTIGKQRVPLGVIGIIYESRPNVTVDAAVLCFKTGNATILRGGSEAFHSNIALVKIIRESLAASNFPADAVQILEDTSRETAQALMKLNAYLDVLIPRGSARLIQAVLENATVPVIETGTGNCHVYIDKEAQQEMATKIIVNAKASRPSVCNAAETLLIHEAVASAFLPSIIAKLREENVEIRGDEQVAAIVPDVIAATESDWETEFADYILAIKVVPSDNVAIAHINQYGTRHSEAIVTDNYFTSQKFLQQVDAAAVYVNASTRFTDGFEFGFGAEIGISTQKLHARGPMGLNELTSTKYIIYGEGQIRE
ncbi:glutamate-5-semialdehyde dehydrogenase [Listeria booriae]|uniref:Gamma-glutamyl phosphate reductase n=1 Tax=Listeria booriae TaxID=1552123 RepID=A0A7X0XC21_9LIST|nr:glutamate-5-semialdehyde dehydrogenase [Listeria booriae]MBC1491454.1 glutamate-5-semialdehyde dehydrogenase [Listeria booriae]MBC1525481.1 glutamate-5-semialdehyde dehydrogenase [Listeria booriae]